MIKGGEEAIKEYHKGLIAYWNSKKKELENKRANHLYQAKRIEKEIKEITNKQIIISANARETIAKRNN